MSSATPFTSGGDVKRRIALLWPCDPSRSKVQRFSLTFRFASNTCSVPVYRSDCERVLSWALRAISSASWPQSTAPASISRHALLILESLHQAGAYSRFGRPERGEQRGCQNRGD